MTRQQHFLATALLTCTTLAVWAQPASWEPLRFEAETCTEPRDAWAENTSAPGKWNLWTNDPARDKIWSGGVVLQAPAVQADRATPEEGLPPLHTTIRDIPPGTYDVELKTARSVAVSRDGKEWRRFEGGLYETQLRIDGTFEVWVDDRYAFQPPGPCYYDCVILHPVPPLEAGFYNPGFELGTAERLPGWEFNGGDGGTMTVVDSGRTGRGRCLRIQHTKELDLCTWRFPWSLRNTASFSVKPGESCVVRAWVKAERNQMLVVRVEGYLGGARISRWVGSAATSGQHDWREIAGEFPVPEGIDNLRVIVEGREATDLLLDDFSLAVGTLSRPAQPKVSGWAKKRVQEPMDRGLIALPCADGTYLSWRLLDSDPADAAFDVYRRDGDGAPIKLNVAPITRTTDFLDASPSAGQAASYTVRRRRVLARDEVSPAAMRAELDRGMACLRIPLAEKVQPSRVAMGDLDGDGRYDYVIKYPGHVVWCWNEAGPDRWQKSPDTYKLEAYTADGRRLWQRDLGWAIEQGLWYSPYIVRDLNGDGRAEVAVKIGEGDPRNAEGRVVSGPEWVSVWNGQTGEEIARAPWPGREGFESYDLVCRHFLSVAYLDGRTPCLLVQRGNYGRIVLDAYQLRDGKLDRLWRWDNEEYGGVWWAQGAHFTQIGDLDGDGRDEIVIGCVAIDDDGTPLWSVNKGHPDYVFMGDVDPARPGWEVFLGLEPPQKRGGNILVDARTGKTVWELGVPTNHVGIDGMCSDIDPTSLGLESQVVDVNAEKKSAFCWLWSADGRILREGERSIGAPWSAYWDADLQREVVRSCVSDFDGGPVSERVSGLLMVADLFGDWREEIVSGQTGELRIYSTTIPATDRRTTLMADPLYRSGAGLYSMGYPQVPMTSVCLDAVSPGLNLTVQSRADGAQVCRVVVSAPLAQGVTGRLQFKSSPGVAVPDSAAVEVAPGQRQVLEVAVNDIPPGTKVTVLDARLEGKDLLLTGRARIEDRRPVTGVALTEAEELAGQGGGEVHVRTDKEKPGVHGGRCFSHWFNPGHWLEWRITAPAGRYRLAWRHSCTADAVRTLAVNGQALADQRFPGTGGFGEDAMDWDCYIARDAGGKPLIIQSDGTPLTVRMQANGGDAGLNLDYLTLLPATE